jgi:DNA-binding YbaB/EbfC family protein
MKGMGNFQKMIKQAKEMQEKIQRETAEMRVEGSVSVTLDGTKSLISIVIDPEVVNKDDVGMLQDLITAAFNDAGTKVDEALSEKLGAFGAGMKIPGLF